MSTIQSQKRDERYQMTVKLINLKQSDNAKVMQLISFSRI